MQSGFFLLTIVAWGGYNVLFKFINGKLDIVVAVLCIGLAQVVVATVWWGVQVFFWTGKVHWQSVPGIVTSLGMGVLLGLGNLFYILVFRYYLPASVAIPVYGVGVLALGVCVGVGYFHEPVTPRLVLGMILAIGVILLLGGGK